MKKLVSVFFFLGISNCFSQVIVEKNLPVTNGAINAIQKKNNKIYIGGDFTQVGNNIPYGAQLDTSTGSANLNFPKFDGVVYSSIADGNGGWYIGGSFKNAGNVPRRGLVQIDQNGNISNLNININGDVNAMLLKDSILYLGGGFSTVGGQSRASLASVNINTGAVTSWNPTVTGYRVFSLALYGSKIYVAGDFDKINGQTRYSIGAIDIATGSLSTWNPNPSDAGYPTYEITSLVVKGSKLYIGGRFDRISGQNRMHMACYDLPSETLTNFNPLEGGWVNTIIISDSVIYVGGYLLKGQGMPMTSIIRIEEVSGIIQDYTFVNGEVKCLVKNGTTLYAGSSNNIEKYNILTFSSLSNWNPGIVVNNPYLFQTPIYTLTLCGNSLFAGGEFIGVGGISRSHLASIDESTGTLTNWDPNADGRVSDMALGENGNIYVSGGFHNVGGKPRCLIASLDTMAGTATSWKPDSIYQALSSYGNVEHIAIDENKLYFAGSFDTVGNQARKFLAALNRSDGKVNNWSPNPNTSVNKILPNKDKIFIAGNFTDIGGLNQAYLAVLDTITGSALPGWDAKIDTLTYNGVYAMTVSGNTLFFSGQFYTINGNDRSGIAALDINSGNLKAWAPYTDGFIGQILSEGSTLYCSGGFGNIGGKERWNLAALEAASSKARIWNPQIQSIVQLRVVNKSKLYLTSNDYPFLIVILAADASDEISGNVFNDMNSNGIKDAGELGIPNAIIEITPSSTICTTDSLGNYLAYCDTGSYSISLISPLYSTSIFPYTQIASFNNYQLKDTLNDFGVRLIPNTEDMKVLLHNPTASRPGFDMTYYLTYINKGTVTQSGSISFVKDPLINFISSSETPSSVSGDSIRWIYNNLIPGDKRNIKILLNVPSTVPLGQNLISLANVTPSIGDADQTNNIDSLQEKVIGSFDPNEKIVFPIGNGNKGSVPLSTSQFTYKINFQNTGTDTAFTIQVKDYIDDDLDISTLEILQTSHPYTFRTENGTAIWTFNNILLADSTTNEKESHGFIIYSIAPKISLAEGTEFHNTGFIYFDYNSAIETNTTVNTLGNSITSIFENKSEKENFYVYPNPSSSEITIRINSDIKTQGVKFEMYDIYGRKVKEICGMKNNEIKISILDLSKGIYFIKNVGQEYSTKKIIVQ